MKRTHNPESHTNSRRTEVLLTLVGVPGAAIFLCGMGMWLLARYRHGDMALTMDVTVALLAAATGALLALWWMGGILLLLGAALARCLHWRGAERWAVRCTPRIMVRTMGAVVGLHLVTVSAAHATEPVTPFWSAPGTSVDQQAPEALGAAQELKAPTTTPAPGATPADPNLEPTASVTEATTVTPRSTPATQRVVDATLTVVQGDTLWDLTAQLLGPDADPAAIAAGTVAWLSHNDLPLDGDLIRPGDRLHVPPSLLTTVDSSSHEGATS